MRYDAGDFGSPVKTANGYLRCDARITKVGVFEYRFSNGTIRRELRLPSEVFKDDSLASFEDVPLTNNHPREPLSSKNTRKYQAGNVKNVRPDGEHVAARVLITDDDAIADVEKGKHQLSCGYMCDLDNTPGVTFNIDGVPDGLQYDAVQRNIVGNHVAIVDKARAGATASLHLDEADAVMVTAAAPNPEPTGPTPGSAGRKKPMSKVRIDDVDFDMDESAAQAVSKVLARLDQATEKVAAAEATAAEQRARADQADEALEAERKARADGTSDEAVRNMVRERVALETTAAKILADGTQLKLDELSDDDIRRRVVVKVSPSAEAKLDAGDAAYLAARFDAAVEAWTAEQDRKPSASKAVLGAAATGTTRCDSKSARAKMIQSNLAMGRDPIRPSTPNQ